MMEAATQVTLEPRKLGVRAPKQVGGTAADENAGNLNRLSAPGKDDAWEPKSRRLDSQDLNQPRRCNLSQFHSFSGANRLMARNGSPDVQNRCNEPPRGRPGSQFNARSAWRSNVGARRARRRRSGGNDGPVGDACATR